MELTREILENVEKHRGEALELLKTLARIPAPSNHEEKRAEFCKNWLEKQGATGVFLDSARNVLYPVGCTKDNPLIAFLAHMDVVFPDTEELPLSVEDGKLKAPGIGDDTANLAALMMAAKYIAEHKLKPKGHGLLLVMNTGEEGLGNLKGSRKIMETYGDRIREFYSLDSSSSVIVNRSVGSRRYRVEVLTEGGHSYSHFGNRNAIAYLASMISTLYLMIPPKCGKTTYNVGTIRGGTSVNTIAQQAEMLYEFRSERQEGIDAMERHFRTVLEAYRTKGIAVNAELIGERPCMGGGDPQRQRELSERAAAAVRRRCGKEPLFSAGSTDCNIPLSMGIPSVCVGCYLGGGAHTREEWIDLSSLKNGLDLVFDLILGALG